MKSGMNVVLGVLVVLTGSSRAGGPSSVLPPGSTAAASPSPSHTGSSAPPDPTQDPGTEAPQWKHDLAGEKEMLTESAAGTPQSQETLPSTSDSQENTIFTTWSSAAPTDGPAATSSAADAASSPAAAEGLSSGPLPTSPRFVSTPDGSAPLTAVSLAAVSSQPARAGTDASSAAPASTAPPGSGSSSTGSRQTTGRPQTPAPGPAPAGPTHHEGPSELNVGDEELKTSHHDSRSRLDPLLAGLLSVFIVSTAIVFVVLFLKFRQRTNHPEFHRLQDLPMDDLMEDTPLSRHSY
ncbi:mucin-1-like [Salarias fasciatus]|uniref:mucin-1-like n=1 Tax=Salarias fasciatus TaxID=181472 RepID=UPI001176D181|nr:mucin-1-like [Salarias fasciatus]